MATADAGNVLVSRTTRDLLAAADFGVELVGTFEFKGLTGPREIFRVAMSQP